MDGWTSMKERWSKEGKKDSFFLSAASEFLLGLTWSEWRVSEEWLQSVHPLLSEVKWVSERMSEWVSEWVRGANERAAAAKAGKCTTTTTATCRAASRPRPQPLTQPQQQQQQDCCRSALLSLSGLSLFFPSAFLTASKWRRRRRPRAFASSLPCCVLSVQALFLSLSLSVSLLALASPWRVYVYVQCVHHRGLTTRRAQKRSFRKQKQGAAGRPSKWGGK